MKSDKLINIKIKSIKSNYLLDLFAHLNLRLLDFLNVSNLSTVLEHLDEHFVYLSLKLLQALLTFGWVLICEKRIAFCSDDLR